MYKQLNITDLLAAIKCRIEQDAGLRTYDDPPENEPAPLVYIELRTTAPEDTKTMFCKRYTVWLHIIAKENTSTIPLYAHIEAVQEAMTKPIILPRGVILITQDDAGVLTIKKDESGERHAVLQYEFKIAYGFKTKENYGFKIYQ